MLCYSVILCKHILALPPTAIISTFPKSKPPNICHRQFQNLFLYQILGLCSTSTFKQQFFFTLNPVCLKLILEKPLYSLKETHILKYT